MRAMNRLVITVAACGLAVAGLSACSSTKPHKNKTVSYQENAPVRTLVIKGDVGDIEVSGGGTSVSVTEKHRFQKVEPVTSHTVANGTLTLGYSCNDPQCGVDYMVKVPAGTAVQISDSTGDIKLSQLSGAVEATTGSGKIAADGLSSPQAQFTTDTGDVEAGFAKSPWAASVKVSTGDVTFTLPTSTKYAVDAHSTTGEVHVEVPQDADAANRITAKVGTGNVTVSHA
ncbi:DUF4097 family beta strand repeat-containing protein [Streptomyces sp. NPDC020801]|uniref:DUF4097 family beta strand repeat-containing protein n=1 Tax=unclassified Streptomyces TaxID=2593676 RepID=UPI0037A70F3C